MESIDNYAKSKSTPEIIAMFDTFEQEKVKLLKQMGLIERMRKEYQKNYEVELQKNTTNEKIIMKQNLEIEKYRKDCPEQKEEKIEKFDIKEREKMKKEIRKKDEKVNLLENQNKGLRTDLAAERDNIDKLTIKK